MKEKFYFSRKTRSRSTVADLRREYNLGFAEYKRAVRARLRRSSPVGLSDNAVVQAARLGTPLFNLEETELRLWSLSVNAESDLFLAPLAWSAWVYLRASSISPSALASAAKSFYELPPFDGILPLGWTRRLMAFVSEPNAPEWAAGGFPEDAVELARCWVFWFNRKN